MTHRLPLGGGALLALGAWLVVPLLIAGCGGDDWRDDYYYGPGPSRFPRYHHVTIILNVSDPAGRALGQVNVWVDGVLQAERTSSQFVALGAGYPESWWGFHANWIKGGFTVATYDYGDVARINVTVSRPGFYSQATEFRISYAQPTEVYARDTFIMEPAVHGASVGEHEPRKKDTPGEVIGWPDEAGEAHGRSVFRMAGGRDAGARACCVAG